MALLLISISEDGIGIEQVDKKKFLADLNDGDYEGEHFYTELLPSSSTEYWESGYILIEGEIIMPKPKEVVTRYEL